MLTRYKSVVGVENLQKYGQYVEQEIVLSDPFPDIEFNDEFIKDYQEIIGDNDVSPFMGIAIVLQIRRNREANNNQEFNDFEKISSKTDPVVFYHFGRSIDENIETQIEMTDRFCELPFSLLDLRDFADQLNFYVGDKLSKEEVYEKVAIILENISNVSTETIQKMRDSEQFFDYLIQPPEKFELLVEYMEVLNLGLNEARRCFDWKKRHSISQEDLMSFYAPKAKELLNMKHFYRLDPKILVKLIQGPDIESIEKQPDDIGLLLLPRSDWNGAFAGKASEKLYSDILTSVPEGHGFCFEVEKEQELYNLIKNIGTKYGKIRLLVIGGHGSKESIALGDRDPRIHGLEAHESFSLSKEDKQDFVDFRLGSFLSADALTYIKSCSTAEGGEQADNVARMIHEGLNTDVFASMTPSNVFDVTLFFSKDGRIESVIIKDENNTVIFEKQRD